MTSYYLDLFIAGERYGNLEPKDPRSWIRADCPDCGASTLAVIAFSNSQPAVWARCTNCMRPVAILDGTMSPSPLPLSEPMGLPDTERAAWREIRACLSVGADTAAVMLCRKLLLHVAVSAGMSPKSDKDRAPTFLETVNYLENDGLITQRMRPWVERIKDVGNEANHELSPIAHADALDVARFTEQLLRLAYEMDSLIKAPSTGE